MNSKQAPPRQEKPAGPCEGTQSGGDGRGMGLDLQFMSLSKRGKF